MNAESILSLYIYRTEYLYIRFALLSMEMLHLHVESLKSYLFQENIFWIEKYIVHYCFVSLVFSIPEEKNVSTVF